MPKGFLDTLGAEDAKNFIPLDGVELVMPNPPKNKGTFPKAWVPNVPIGDGVVRVTLVSGQEVNVPVSHGVPVILTAKTFERTGTTIEIIDILGML